MALPIPTGKPPFSRQSPRPPRQSPQDKFEAVDDAAIGRRSRECRADHGSLSSHLFFKGCECALNRCADSPVLLLGYPIDCVCGSWGYPAGKLLCAACTAPASLFWAGGKRRLLTAVKVNGFSKCPHLLRRWTVHWSRRCFFKNIGGNGVHYATLLIWRTGWDPRMERVSLANDRAFSTA